MNFKLPLIAAFAALLTLAACGGGGGSSAPTVYDAPALIKTDTVVGTGPEAAVGMTITVNYTLWLYDTTKAGNKGTQIDSGTRFETVLANGALIQGWIQGIPGMKVGGKRTLTVPASLGYGTSGSGKVPANSGLVFDIELITVHTNVYDAPALVKTDTVVGTGAEAAVGKTITVNYTLWLYDTNKAGNKGTQIDSGTGFKTVLSNSALIEGWVQGIPGMKVGGKRNLVVPASLGYGASGYSSVPGNSGLVFDVELTAVN